MGFNLAFKGLTDYLCQHSEVILKPITRL